MVEEDHLAMNQGAHGFAALAQALAVDAMTVEVAGAMRAAGLRPVLLKGPVIAMRLYGEDEARSYGDADLLVDPRRTADAEAVLTSLGFERQHFDWEPFAMRLHATTWLRRADGGVVDLHSTLPGLRGVTPERAWRRLAPRLEAWRQGPAGLLNLDEPGLGVLLALHVFHHLHDGEAALEKPRKDLERALTGLSMATWRAAAQLAAELRAQADVSAGLHAVEGGPELAARLGLPPPSSGPDDMAGVERLAGVRGWRGWARAIMDALLPSPSYLRWTSRLARRGPLGLLATYLSRPFLLTRALVRMATARRRD